MGGARLETGTLVVFPNCDSEVSELACPICKGPCVFIDVSSLGCRAGTWVERASVREKGGREAEAPRPSIFAVSSEVKRQASFGQRREPRG